MELKKEKKRQMKRDRDRLSLASEQELLQVADDQKIPKKNMNKDSPWNFEVEYNDHFETPKIAYTDLLPVLQQAARDSKKSLSELIVYDPYYCAGRMVPYLHELGVTNVINMNRDFYVDVETDNVPDHDIIVTNPPYSGEHKQRLLEYLAQAGKPFCLLLPAYIAAKSYWREFVAAEKDKNDKNTSKSSTGLQLHELYLLPPTSYEYTHPEGTGKELPPFFSSWFIGGGFRSLLDVRRAVLNPESNPRCLSVCVSVDSLIKRGVISADSIKRPNPRQRKKNKKQKL